MIHFAWPLIISSIAIMHDVPESLHIQDLQAEKNVFCVAGIGGYLKQVSLIVIFVLLNSLLNLANKWSLGIFPYPILLTSCQMASTVIFLSPVMLLRYNR